MEENRKREVKYLTENMQFFPKSFSPYLLKKKKTIFTNSFSKENIYIWSSFSFQERESTIILGL